VAIQTYNPYEGWSTAYWAWVENLGGTDEAAHFIFQVNCGDHMYVKAWDSGTAGCLYIERINDGKNSGDQCYGPSSDEQTAEAIVELDTERASDLADFGTETFYGVGITDNGSYKAMSNVPHDFFNMYHCSQLNPKPTGFQDLCNVPWGHELAWTGPIQNDPGDTPYDEYAVHWAGNYY
jgi:hypothetical protein